MNQEQRSDEETIDLTQVLLLVRNNLVLLVAVTLICALVGMLVTTFLITPQYKASATMIVNSQQEQASAAVTNDQITTAQKLVSIYSIIIKSDTVLNQVIANLGLPISYDALKSKVSVSAVDSTQVMEIAVQDSDPAWAKSVVAEITKVAPDIIKDTVEAGSVKIISAARAQEAPVSPNRVRNTAIAGLLGLVSSFAFVFLREMLNNTFKTDEDIQKYLGVPVIGVIPRAEG